MTGADAPRSPAGGEKRLSDEWDVLAHGEGAEHTEPPHLVDTCVVRCLDEDIGRVDAILRSGDQRHRSQHDGRPASPVPGGRLQRHDADGWDATGARHEQPLHRGLDEGASRKPLGLTALAHHEQRKRDGGRPSRAR